jgi:hypothetical protein
VGSHFTIVRSGQVRLLGGAISILLLAGVPVGGQVQAPVERDAARPAEIEEPVAAPHAKEDFAGTWDYNADDSIDIRTGRPEQRPRSATQRGGLTGTGRAGTSTTRAGGGGGSNPASPARAGATEGAGGAERGGGVTSSVGPTPEMIRETRDTARDLLEVAERLTIKVNPDTVSITDDLDRERTYLTDGRRQRHQIAAARFEIRSEWRDSQLVQQIAGGFDFKMTQTFFLSPDGRRLFLMVRVGQPRKNVPQVGFNRVYDRVE